MLDDKRLIYLLGFLVIVPLLGYLVVPFLNNPDTYYFYFDSCGVGDISNQPFLAKLVFYVIPCSIFVYKVIPFALLLASTFLVWKIGLLLYEKYAFISPIALFLTPSWVLMFSKFENDTFAYFTLILSLYFFVKTLKIDLKKDYWKNMLLTIISLTISGLIWEGSFFFLIILATASLPLLLFGTGIMILGITTPGEIFGHLLSFIKFAEVGENAPIIGFILLLSLNLALTALKKELKWPTIITIIIAILNVKLAWFAIPLLALSFPNLLQKIEKQKGKILTQKFASFIIFIAIFTSIAATSVIVLHPFPTYEMMDGAERTVQLSEETGFPIFNDWSMGYFVKYFGGEPSNIGQPSGFTHSKNSVVYTIREMDDCEIIETYYKTINGAYMRLWLC